MQTESQPNDQNSSTNLPALLPTASLVLRRTETSLGLMRKVVQESSVDYWCKLGDDAESNYNWPKAKMCFLRAFQLNEDFWYTNLKLGLVMAVELDRSLSLTAEQDEIKIKNFLHTAFTQAYAEHGNLERIACTLEIEQWQFLMKFPNLEQVMREHFPRDYFRH